MDIKALRMIGLWALLGCACAESAAQPSITVLQPERFSESLRAQLAVGGDEVVRGLWLAPAPEHVSLARLHVHVPPGPPARLCLQLESQDGKYFGEAEYAAGRRTALQTLRLTVPTQHRSVVERLSPGALAARVALAKDCTTPSSTLLPVSWMLGNARPDTLVVQLSSGSAGIRAQLYDGASDRYAKCSLAGYLLPHAFNRECTYPSEGRRGNLTLFVLRHHGERKLKGIELNVYMP
jgi:hypothetical protein